MLKIKNFTDIGTAHKNSGYSFNITKAIDGDKMYFVEYNWWSLPKNKWKRLGFCVMKEMVTWSIYRCYVIDYATEMAYPYTTNIDGLQSKHTFLERLDDAAKRLNSGKLKGDLIRNTPDLC